MIRLKYLSALLSVLVDIEKRHVHLRQIGPERSGYERYAIAMMYDYQQPVGRNIETTQHLVCRAGSTKSHPNDAYMELCEQYDERWIKTCRRGA